MNDVQLAKILGLFSLGLGAVQLFASRRIADAVGVASPGLVKAVGVRELVAGVMVLNKPDTAMPLWSRVAGDAMDVAILASGLGARRRGGVLGGLVFTVATAALDVAVASSLNRRDQTALQTARRTRVKTVLS